jgi:glycosyltransferase involved in cell wall biosynthesis
MSTDQPLVTIGIPSYQSARFIGEAITSALSQDIAELEVLVIDDASTDGTLEVARSFDDARLRVLSNAVNLGPGRNWNRVLEEARGRYVKVMGSDDVLLPGSVSAEVAILEAEPEVVIVTGPRLVVTEGGWRMLRRGNGGLRGRVKGDVAGREMIRRGTNLIGEPCAALLRMSAVRVAGGFHEGNPYCIDMEMWLRLIEVGDVYVLERPVCKYRIVGASWSAAVGGQQGNDVVALLRSSADRGAFGTSAADAEAGKRNAHAHAIGRRLLYRALFEKEMRQRLLYLVVGGWNTLFGYLAFAGLYYLLGERIGYAPVFIVSYAVSMLNAYWGYKLVVFRTPGKFRHEFPRFSIVYVVALGVNLVVFPWLTRTLGLNPYLSQAIFTVVLVVCTYIVNKRFSFRQRPER